MKCLLDLDGVIVDLIAGIMRVHSIPDPYLNPRLLGVWDFSAHSGIQDFWKPANREFWENLDFMPDGHDILHLVERVFGQKNICLLTAPTSDESETECIVGKIAFIKKRLPQYKKQYFVGHSKEFCAHPNSVLIDDRDENIEKFKAERGFGILVPRIWNSNHSYRHDAVGFIQGALT